MWPGHLPAGDYVGGLRRQRPVPLRNDGVQHVELEQLQRWLLTMWNQPSVRTGAGVREWELRVQRDELPRGLPQHQPVMPAGNFLE
jgi:hypothetical protein